jgi:hypothetical protein
MPFLDQHGKFPNPDLQFLGTREFKLTTKFSYRLPDTENAEFLVAPMETDLASIPGPLWGLAGPYGKQILPVLLHDTLCNDAKKHHSFEKRKRADDTFRVALGDQGNGKRDVSRIRSRVLWVGVSLDRYWQYSRLQLWTLVVPLLLLTIAALMAIPIISHLWLDNWWITAAIWLLVLTLVQIFGSLSKSDGLLVLILVGAAIAPPVVLIMALTVATTIILNAIPWTVLRVLPGVKQGPSPELGPTTVGRAKSAAPRRQTKPQRAQTVAETAALTAIDILTNPDDAAGPQNPGPSAATAA